MNLRLILRTGSLIGAAFIAGGQANIPNPRQYRNVDYEFSVRIPPGYHGCMTATPNPNHGVWIPLDRHWPCTDSKGRVRYVGVFAEYNVAEEAPSAAVLAAIECRWRGARHIVWLKRERISGRKAAGCRRDFADGHIEVTNLVLRKTEAWRARWIEVNAYLVTTPDRYRADMRVYRRVLRGIWVHPDGPQR